jgi:predicted peptidase
MTTRREVFPLLAGAGAAASVACSSKQSVSSEPELRRVSYASKLTGAERDYLVYLPPDHATRKSWPVILFLHGDGERGDAKADLDYVLCHGPIYEAWIQRRDLPFVMISPQLPLFRLGETPFFRNRTRDIIPQRAATPPARPDENTARLNQPLQGAAPPEPFNFGADADTEGWQSLEPELVSMIDHAVAEFGGDPRHVYVTGLSRGGFGAWHFAARHPDKVAAVAPVVGFGHPDLAEPIAKAKLPVWQFAGGRDPSVPIRQMYPLLNRLESLGHDQVRFTVHEDLGHFAWIRVYGGQDVYDWMLAHPKA